ncbi:alpha/beta fold hydrolase [Sphingomonas immobilis]|uniref:Alpha/beta hydrolase n=1 Tax=Sphingomonas immobilis TaxID=3063997 RepID=A0ABT8ZWY1_9SPHN|nr:alpha/beta hydrolase [Sphingomonas sp. CA1-15]MDO7842085.1 alpha/beta hydrolase [Sphingomonas sp. CA1-15]
MTGDEATAAWLRAQWAVPATEHAVAVEGARITYRGWNLDAHDLPGLLLIHGFRAHARWWDHIAPSLARTHRVAAISLSGMGDSDRRPAYARAQMAREVLAVAADCGFDPVTLVAHSFGAMSGIMASIASPDRVRRLVIIDTALPTAADVGHQIPVPPKRLYATREEAMERFRLIPPGAWPNPLVLKYIAHHSVRETAEGWTWKFDEDAATSLNAEAHAYRADLFGITVPTDVIYGAESEIMTPERRAMAAEIAVDCGIPVEIPCTHHHIMIEQPVALAAALDALLATPRNKIACKA